MGKCLITKLNGTVDNTSILKLGELRISILSGSNTSNSLGVSLRFSKDVNIKILGDSHFTDETLSANYGKTLALQANQAKNIYVSSPCAISVNKYFIKNIGYINGSSNSETHTKQLSLDDLKYSNSLVSLYLSNSSLQGDISNIPKSIKTFDVGNTSIKGNYEAFKHTPNISFIDVRNTDTEGNIDSLSNCTKLSTCCLQSCYGDIGSLSNLTNLESLTLYNSDLTGDLATLPQNIKQIEFLNNKGTFTWGTRNVSYSIFSINTPIQINNLDSMLINLSSCTKPNGVNSGVIKLIGTRTSASDAAVQTLQSKGYTVSITPAL